MFKLSKKEQKTLVKLMKKMSFPVPLEVFEAWCRVFGTVCAEAVVVRKNKGQNEIFLTYRKDKFFKGWHIPGCTHLPIEKIEDTLKRVMKKEIGILFYKASQLGWFERVFGRSRGQSQRGHEFSIVFVVRTSQKVKEDNVAKFFPLKKLPKNIMHHQLPIIKKLKEFF